MIDLFDAISTARLISVSARANLSMFWRSGFSRQDIRVFLLRLRKGRLLLSQQDEGKQKQGKKQPTIKDRHGLGAESLLGSNPGQASSAKPALSQWAAKSNRAGQRFIWRDLLAAPS